MKNNEWFKARLEPEKQGELWELFHENSKTKFYTPYLSNEEVYLRMVNMHPSLPYASIQTIQLPPAETLTGINLGETILSRASSLSMTPESISLAQLATILHMAYGETRDLTGYGYARPFRTVPSGGGLYPLELYFYNRGWVQGLERGIYHFNPTKHILALLFHGDFDTVLKEAMVQKELINGASGVFFITALFKRSTFKYGDRGYRFALIEAGHVSQNFNLVAAAYNLGMLNIGGFFDHQIDEMLQIDGVEHSTLYLNLIGKSNGR